MQSPPLVAVVDDDSLVRSSLMGLLRSMGLQARAFDSAEAFLAESNEAVDCVISDMQMPGMSGLALQRVIRANRPALPVIFMTAFPDAMTRKRALADGAGCYLEKPCSADDLSRCLDRALNL